MAEQIVVFAVIALSLYFFIKSSIRYDVTAVMALLVLVAAGVVNPDQAFSGFGHPAVVTVAAVLIISRGLLHSGIVDFFARNLMRLGKSLSLQVLVLTCLVTLFSGFMNNVGALALFLPVALRMARRSNRSPSLYLMPLAFGSLLGGMTTLIGTPPNIIISLYRVEELGRPFLMFDFLPVGLSAALAGVLLLALFGWRLMPRRATGRDENELFRIEEYISELKVLPGSRFIGRTLGELTSLGKWDILVLAMVRDGARIPAPRAHERVNENDILVVEADPELLGDFAKHGRLELAGKGGSLSLGSERLSLYEVVVMPDSYIAGRTARSVDMRNRFGANLLGVARQGKKLTHRLGDIQFRGGDILLLQAVAEGIQDTFTSLGCLPLAVRDLRLGDKPRILPAVGIFAAAITIIAFDLLKVQIALVIAAVAMVLSGLVTLRKLYESIEWPVIVMLGALIPVGEALETTGGAESIAGLLLLLAGHIPPALTLVALMMMTILLTNIINNAAATVLMAPIAIGIAHGLGLSPDPFLMAVAVSASAAFMTPVGHQSNTLVMGPGGYRFGDYWKPGLPLTIVVLAASVPAILRFWPF
ncbi:MAG: SLC13 family permease [Candidatus Fermentibacteraceae bacterium]